MKQQARFARPLFGAMCLFLVALIMAGCELTALPEATPTIQTLDTTPTVTTQPPTLTPSHTSSAPPQLASSTFTPTPSEPTVTPTVTITPGPFAYIIQEGDTYYYIMITRNGYADIAQANGAIPEFLRVNAGIRNIDSLPSPGSTIYIPIPLPTPTPEGFDMTQTAQPNNGDGSGISEDTVILQVPIQENDSILRFAQEYQTTLSILATLNPDLSFFGCDYGNPSGGPDCNVFMVVGENVNVPAPTPTRTLSPTPSGNETATPTPTHPAPPLVFPPQNASAPARTFQLQWVGVSILQNNEVYFVELQDLTANTTYQDVTRGTYYELPESLVPGDGQAHNIQWRVSVARRTTDGTYVIVGAIGNWRTFSWQNR